MVAEEVEEARRHARRLHHKFGVTSREHLNVEAWVQSFGIELVEARLDGAAAQLVRVRDQVQIVLPEGQAERGTTRFSIAHEFCHCVRKHSSPSTSMMCTPRAFRLDDEKMKIIEIAANAFAGELLLPTFLLRKLCETSPVCLDIPWRIAKDYDVSILSAAIRFAELTSERCAAVFSRGNEVVWAARSATFAARIPRRKLLDRQSVAWDFFAGRRLDDRAQFVPADAWLDTTESVDIVEHSLASHEHGTVLSLLWVPEVVAARLDM